MKLLRRIFFFSMLTIPLAVMVLFSFSAYSSRSFGSGVIDGLEIPDDKVFHIEGGLHGIRDNRFRRSDSGLFEMFVQGAPLERGVFAGRLSRDLMIRQEQIFIEMMKRFVRNRLYRFFLKNFIYMFNRSIQDHIPQEFLQEIYGISRGVEGLNNELGNAYMRILNYHAAHDIGHMLENMNLVGCTAFSVKGDASINGDLITARNFDFYIGDRFAEEKIVSFIKPDNGIPFMKITWGGMTGVISGMNLEGLSVVINAAESGVPNSTGTPVSLVAREILQYAGNIKEAYKIALERELFVNQIFFVSSASDNKSAIIEKKGDTTEIFYPRDDYAALTNHFVGKLKGSEVQPDSDPVMNSKGRLKRVKELLESAEKIDEKGAVAILRDTKGVGGTDVEPGSELAINQYLAHHSVVFNNTLKIAYVSTSPWQFGEFKAYELEKVFNDFPGLDEDREISTHELTIEADSFMETDQFQKVKKSRDDGTFKPDDIRFRKDGLNI